MYNRGTYHSHGLGRHLDELNTNKVERNNPEFDYRRASSSYQEISWASKIYRIDDCEFVCDYTALKCGVTICLWCFRVQCLQGTRPWTRQVFKLGDGKNEGQISCLQVDNRWNAELRLHKVVGIARVAAI